METAVSVAEIGIQKEQTQNLRLSAEQVASSGAYEAIRREQFLARRARKARLRRMVETEEQKKARIAKDLERARSRRLNETEEEKRARRAKDAENARLRRLAQSEEKKGARLAKNAEQARLRRREQKEKSEHLAKSAEMLNTSEMIHSQTDSDKCEEGQGGSQQSETSFEQIAPSTSSKTTDELESRQEGPTPTRSEEGPTPKRSEDGPTPKRSDKSEQRKERLAKVIDKVKLGKVKEIDQQIKRCYARIAEVIGTDGLIEISNAKKDMEGETKERTSPLSATLPGNKVNDPFTHTQDSVLYSLLSSSDEVSLPENTLLPGKKHDADTGPQMVSMHDAEAIGSLQLSPVESSLAGTVQENEGRISRNSQSPDIIMIKEVVKAADKISIPTVSHQQPVSVCDDSINRGQTVISRSDAEQLSSGNECKPKSYTRTARKARLRRWAETEQQRKDRLAREAKRARLKRLAETEDQKRARLAKAAENAKMWRSRAREQKAEDVAIRKS